MKKISILVAGILCVSANAVNWDDAKSTASDLKDLYDKGKTAYENINNQFKNLKSKLPSSLQQCIPDTPNVEDKFGDLNICQKASELDKLNLKVCGNKSKILNSSAISQMCNDAGKKFEDYSSKQVGDYGKWQVINTSKSKGGSGGSSSNHKLPNGQTQEEYNANWEISNIMKTENTVGSYLSNGNMEAVNTFMDYAKSSGAKTDISKIKIEDLPAPKTLAEYDKGITDSVIKFQSSLAEITPKKITSDIASQLANTSPSNYANVVNQYLEKQKANFDIAKQIEISQALANSDYKKIAIPTEDYIKSMRDDLRPVLVGQIRKQQAYEVEVVSKIEEKYQRKYDIATLLGDKEIIMVQAFDEKTAKAQIEQIAKSANQDK